MQVIFRSTYWIRAWSQLDKPDEAREMLKRGCRLLETMILEVFAKFGWKFTNRITT
jgi:hypothetical protein